MLLAAVQRISASSTNSISMLSPASRARGARADRAGGACSTTGSSRSGDQVVMSVSALVTSILRPPSEDLVALPQAPPRKSDRAPAPRAPRPGSCDAGRPRRKPDGLPGASIPGTYCVRTEPGEGDDHRLRPAPVREPHAVVGLLRPDPRRGGFADRGRRSGVRLAHLAGRPGANGRRAASG